MRANRLQRWAGALFVASLIVSPVPAPAADVELSLSGDFSTSSISPITTFDWYNVVDGITFSLDSGSWSDLLGTVNNGDDVTIGFDIQSYLVGLTTAGVNWLDDATSHARFISIDGGITNQVGDCAGSNSCYEIDVHLQGDITANVTIENGTVRLDFTDISGFMKILWEDGTTDWNDFTDGTVLATADLDCAPVEGCGSLSFGDNGVGASEIEFGGLITTSLSQYLRGIGGNLAGMRFQSTSTFNNAALTSSTLAIAGDSSTQFSVPEPTSLSLIALGMLGLAAMPRRGGKKLTG